VWHDEYHPVSWLITNLIDTVSRGGNFQVGYGPMPDGTWAPEIERRLEAVGQWLKIHGEGIYHTRPCATYGEGDLIRYTQSKDGRHVYAFVMGWPDAAFAGGQLRLEAVRAARDAQIELLGLDHTFKFTQDDAHLCIELPHWLCDPEKRPGDCAVAFKIPVAP
jgi:alpha-L-fucosidase